MLSHTRALLRGKLYQRSLATVSGVQTVGVVGLGLMGHGIAQSAAAAGYTVIGVDLNETVRKGGQAAIEASVGKMAKGAVKRGKATEEEAAATVTATIGRLSYAASTAALADCDLIVEAIVENMDIKTAFYAELGALAHPKTIFASNTSSLPITPMAEASGRPDRFVGLHYFNPVQLMPLVEVVGTTHTDPEVFALAESWATSCGKRTVSCQDTPGFIVNRLLVPNLAQAIGLYDRGHASIPDIDVSMQLGAGNPMGPFTLADYVGLDTIHSILEGWIAAYPDDPSFVMPESLVAKVNAGDFGRKSGKGFYVWGDGPASTKPTGLA